MVNVLSGDTSTAWDDRRGYMIVDAWGPCGGPELEETVVGGSGTPQTLYVSLQAPADSGRRFVVQAVPGLTPDSDGELLDLSSGPKPLRLAADQTRTLIVTAMPTGPYDPDLRTEARYPFSIILSDKP